jgi:hypothetical protein
MRKLILWLAGGLTLAIVCGLAGLAHLSASFVTLTVFCALPTVLVIALDAWPKARRERT